MQDKLKTINKIIPAETIPEDEHYLARRVIGGHGIFQLDPFLLFEDFTVELPSGFLDHPHRGFDKVTYLFQGSMAYEDFRGNEGVLYAGDCQWLTTGRGLVHAEVPTRTEKQMKGIQLWINLSNRQRLCETKYQEINKDNIPVYEEDNVTVKVIAGEAKGVRGLIQAATPTLFLDVEMNPNSSYQQSIHKNWNSICYVVEGNARLGKSEEFVGAQHAAIFNLGEGNFTEIHSGDEKSRVIVLAGKPIEEDYIHQGPFVVGSVEDLMLAMQDYDEEKNGFEGAKKFVSKIREIPRETFLETLP